MFKKSALIATGLTLTFAASSASAAALIYEGFEVGDGTLNANAGGLGLSGNWSSNSLTTAGSLTYGTLQTSGGKQSVNTGTQFNKGEISPGTTLSSAGLMNDGAVLWMSVLIDNIDLNGTPASNDLRSYVTFGAGNSDGFDRIGDGVGGGFGIVLNKQTFTGQGAINVQAWNDGGQGGAEPGATRGTLSANNVAAAGTILAVGKFTWGAFGVTEDLFELYLPDTSLALGSVVGSMTADFDQLGVGVIPGEPTASDAFDTISFSGGRSQNGVPQIDEIRFGATYADVTPVPEPGSLALLGLGGLLIARRRRA